VSPKCLQAGRGGGAWGRERQKKRSSREVTVKEIGGGGKERHKGKKGDLEREVYLPKKKTSKKVPKKSLGQRGGPDMQGLGKKETELERCGNSPEMLQLWEGPCHREKSIKKARKRSEGSGRSK